MNTRGRRRSAPKLVAPLVIVAVALCVSACGGDDDVGGDGGVPDARAGDAAGTDAAGLPDSGVPPRDGGGGTDAGPGPSLGCAPLAPSGGTEVRVTPDRADELVGLVRDAAPGTTFVLEDGTYRFSGGDEGSRRLQIRAAGVTLRSASDDAERVILDGEYQTEEMVFITASNVTLAHLTLTHAVNHPVHVTPPSGGPNVTGVLLYGLRIIDGGEQFVKINSNGDRSGFVDDGRIECSFFQLTDAGRPRVERCCGGCYTGGVDAHYSRGWVVRNNRFEDIYCAGEGLAEHAVHFWSASRDTLVENNTIVRCARGIGFGLVRDGNTRSYADDPYPGVGYIGHYDGIIRNNVIYADHPYFDTGIELDQARGARVYHNTVYSTAGATGFFSSIDYRFENTDVDVRNNITRRITNRDGAGGRVENNLEDAAPALFVDASGLDFHLAPGATAAIDQGVTVPEAGVDIDGDSHDLGAAPDLGADERRP